MGKILRKKWIYLLVPVLLLLLTQMVWAEELVVSDGDKVVLMISEGDFALSSAPNDKGLMAEQPETATVWTACAQDDGSWILESDQGRLSVDPETGLLTLNAAGDCWILTDLDDGTVSLTNLSDNRVLTWYPAHETFGLADSESEFSRLKLVIIPAEPETPETDPT